jgi:regulator of sigma E protease
VSQILSWAGVWVAVVLLFGAAIFVHEFGHFWMARRRGLKVEGFSLGFGPKIYGWTRDGIEYAWRWIPAGGYVKLPQMVTSETLEGKSDAAEKLPPVSPWSKVLVAVAGPLMNAVFAFAIATVIYFVGLPVRVNPAIIGGVEPNSPEARLGLRPGDRIVAVNSKLVKSWDDAQETTWMARTNVLPVTIERDGVQTTYNLTALADEQLGVKLLNLDPQEHPVIEQVQPDSAAQNAGLKTGDEVLAYAGIPVVGQRQLINLIQKRPGETSPIEILRDRQRLKINVTPRLDPAKKIGLLGILIAPNSTSVYQVQRPGPLPWELVGQICGDTFNLIGALVHSKQTGIGVKDLSGPPGILAALALELKMDYRLGLKFMVLLNLNLAILNLLPLPVLDGGHITMALLEKLRGRPVSLRLQEYATTAFAVLLISFMLYVSYNDVVRRLPLFRFLFKQQVQIQSGASPSNAPAAGP